MGVSTVLSKMRDFSSLAELPKLTVISVAGYLSKSPDKFAAIAGVAAMKFRARSNANIT